MNIYPSGSIIANRYEVIQGPMEKHSLVGGMGIVYLCLDHQENHPVALKTFRPEFLPDRTTRDRFLREGTTWVNLGKHPHIVCCYQVDYIGDGREIYLSLELIAQEPGFRDASLRSWLRPGHPLPLEQSLLFALQIVRGMNYACEKNLGFVHRDLKPENILVGTDRLWNLNINRLRVTDFGLANVLSNSETISQAKDDELGKEPINHTRLTKGVVGTPLYMAPEQWLKGELGTWTDIYAVGCILYEMLTGQVAVQGNNPQELGVAHCEGRIQPLPSQLPGTVHNLIDSCLQMDSQKRYSDWKELDTVLAEIWENISDQKIPETTYEKEKDERSSMGWSYCNIGICYADIGKIDVARSYFEQAYAFSKDAGEQRLETVALGNLGNAFMMLGDATRAISYHTRAQEISSKISSVAQKNSLEWIKARQWESADLGNLGNSYLHLGDIHLAIKCFEQSLAISKEIGHQPDEGSALGNLGIAYLQLGNARQAISFLELALESCRKFDNRRNEGNLLSALGNAYLRLGDSIQAISYFEQGLAISREIGDRRGEGTDLGNLGNAYNDSGYPQRAISYYEQCLDIHRETRERYKEVQTLGNLGVAYMGIGEFQRAIGYHEQALKISREIEDKSGEGVNLGNLGNAYMALGDPYNAISYFEQCLLIHRQTGERHFEAVVMSNLGSVYRTFGNNQKALSYYQQALELSRELEDRDGIATTSYYMALLHAQKGELEDALLLAEQAAHTWSQIDHMQNVQKAKNLISELRNDLTRESNLKELSLPAFRGFLQSKSITEMQILVRQYPFMTDDVFIQVGAQIIEKQMPPHLRPELNKRLEWLRKLRK